MSKPYNIYNTIGLFVGSNISTGYNFIDFAGSLTNNDSPNFNFNLVFPINRVQSVQYSFSETRTDIKSLGSYGNISRPILIQPNINLSFSYYLMSCINDARIGFYINQPSGYSTTGTPIYGHSMNICPISGFIDRTNARTNETTLNYPFTQREPKNFYVATSQDFNDLNDYSTGNYKSSNTDVFAFGDCYLNSYKQSTSVNQIPLVNVDFICNNLEYYNYASGKNIPSINPKDGSIRSGIIFNLPNNFETTNKSSPTVLLPSDISVDIKSVPSGDYLSTVNNNVISTVLDVYGDKITLNQDADTVNLPISISDLKLQSYNFELNLNREPLYNIGYKFPLDRRINFPVFCNLDFNAIVGENRTGSLIKFINKDREWDITIKLSFQPYQSYTGVAIIYKFLGSKFNSLSIEDGIDKLRTANFSFTTELNPNYNTRGFFISGILGIPNNKSIELILGTGIGDGLNPIEMIDFSEILLSNGNIIQPLY